MPCLPTALLCLTLCGLAWLPAQVSAQSLAGCDMTLRSDGNGPYDYRTQRNALAVVEKRHFTAAVERLQRGESTTQPGPDLDYTLNKFPNHHRALLTLVRLGEKLKGDRDPTMQHSISCRFERALRFRADDILVRLIYAMHLHKLQMLPAAQQQLARASSEAGDNGLTHYNIGMVYSDLGLLDEALVSAHRAMQLGVLNKPELKQRLERAGRWREPVAAAEAASAPASEPASAPASAASA
jgi:tetratricopeptide (TPR) repeat protein